MRRRCSLPLLGLFLVPLAAQPILRLKAPSAGRENARGGAALERERPGHAHFVVQFRQVPGSRERQVLESRGLRVLEYLPDNAFVVSGRPPADLSGLDVEWQGALSSEQKVSAWLDPAELNTAIIQLQTDADAAAVRAAVISAGVEILEHPDLDRRDLLVRAAPGALAALAGLDDVSYIFPASRELITGAPAFACHSGIANLAGEQLTSSNLTSTFGDGWDGPGLGSASLSFWYGALTPSLPAEAAAAEIQRALAAWSEVVNVDFHQVDTFGNSNGIDISFVSGSHGDGAPFDGPGRVIAHTFYPPPNPESIAGDLHFDLSETWRIGADIDLYSVALHELGHALGLGHSDDPNSVMYPYYRKVSQLQQPDIDAIRTLYASRSTGGAEPADPVDPVTPEAPAAPLPPTVRILTPTTGSSYTTAGASILLAGTVESAGGVRRVEWKNSLGYSGTARGTTSWTAGPISLYTGSNVIQVIAYAQDGSSASASIEVTREATTLRDYTPPTIRISSPSSSSWPTTASTIIVRGTATDNTSVASVSWSNSAGGSGAAEGTTSWSTPPIDLAFGANVITIRVQDEAGNQAWRTVQVTRR